MSALSKQNSFALYARHNATQLQKIQERFKSIFQKLSLQMRCVANRTLMKHFLFVLRAFARARGVATLFAQSIMFSSPYAGWHRWGGVHRWVPPRCVD
jgi:hypothetical protein